MSTLARAESKHMYSWWWDSHISPKNSKWLHENLTDMDAKVKLMIKLIEVDEDSFARRAEMYYKKRPELMKLVEEFYRAFRALAERYDHATGVIKQAHKTMAEAFPNQVPLIVADDISFNSPDYSSAYTPEMLVSVRAFCDPDDFRSTERSSALGSWEDLSFSKVKKGLNFHDADQKEVKNQTKLSEPDSLGKSETGIQELQETLARLEAEKQAGLLEYVERLRRLSNLESEVARAQEDSRELHERASNAEAEVLTLKESLAKLEGEREACLHQYQQCLDMIAKLETEVSHVRENAEIRNQQASLAVTEAHNLRQEFVQLKADKEAGLAEYMKALEKIANLEIRLLLAESKANVTIETANNAEKEIFTLKEALDRSAKEKEIAALQYQLCLEKIASLESEIALFHVETARLKDQIDHGVETLKGAEEKYNLLERSNSSMQCEMDSLLNKLGIQNQELLGNQNELGRLRTCVEEERLRFVGVETAFKTLQGLHSQIQDELRFVASELQNRVELLKERDFHNQSLHDEVQKIRVENKSLTEHNLTSTVLKKNLEHENFKLKEICQRSEAEISSLLENLGVMEELIEKKVILERSMSELSAQLEDARGRVKELEESSKLLMNEKAALSCQLDTMTENLEKISQKNTSLENSLRDTNSELEALKKTSKNLEDSFHFLNNDKSILLSERGALELKLETAQQRLEELGKKNEKLEQKYSSIEEERKSALKLVDDLHNMHADEKQGYESAAQLGNMQMAEMVSKIRLLEEVGQHTMGQLEEELDQSVSSQFEICILRNVLQDLKETNSSLLDKCGNLLETSKLSEELILELEHENIEQQQEGNFLSEHIKRLRTGILQMLKMLDADMEPVFENSFDKDQRILHRILVKLDDTRSSLCKAWDENQKLLVEKTVVDALLGQFRQEISELKAVINTLQQECRVENDQFASLKKDMEKLLQSHEQLIRRIEEGNHKEEIFVTEVVNLRAKLQEVQQVCLGLEKEKCRMLEDKRSLTKTVNRLDDEINKLEDDNSCLVIDTVTSDTLSLIFKSNVLGNAEVISQLTDNICKLLDDNIVLEDKMKIMESVVDRYQVQNVSLKDSREKLNDELDEVKTENEQLSLEIARSKAQLSIQEVDFSEALVVKDEQQKQISELSAQYDQLLQEMESLRNSMQNASAEVCRALEKQKETDRTVEIARLEVKNVKVEAEMWETVAGTFFSELQTTSVREALFRDKFSELGREYEGLEIHNNSQGLEAVQLKERVGALELEKNQIKAQLDGHMQALATLKDSVASLESHATRNKVENDNDKGASSSSSTEPRNDHVVSAPTSDGNFILLDLAARIKAVESKMIETKRCTEERSVRALRSRSSRSRRSSGGRSSRHIASESMEEQPEKRRPHRHNTKHNHSCGSGELLMKDIMLDQASEANASSRWKNRRGGYNNSQGDDQILELWETMNQAGSIDLTVGKAHSHHHHRRETMENDRIEHHSSGSIVEKELVIDSLELSKTAPTELDRKMKILDRLASDVQKATNLQITVQDLKQKLMIRENSNPASRKEIEHMRVKQQIDEADRSIAKIVDVNSKLIKNLKTSTSTEDSLETGGSGRTRRVSEQARKCSEKIGRLQLEVQKIQFIIIKFDGGNETGRGSGTRVVERNTRTLLKDYLYASSRTPRRRRGKSHFCWCVQQPNSGE